MYSPLRHAADEVLRRSRKSPYDSLDEFLDGEKGKPDSVLCSRLAILTDGIIVVDRRTVSRWARESE